MIHGEVIVCHNDGGRGKQLLELKTYKLINLKIILLLLLKFRILTSALVHAVFVCLLPLSETHCLRCAV